MMDQAEIIRRNEATAKYMGWKNDSPEINLWYLSKDGNIIEQQHPWQLSPAFNTDWGLLMPAVEKILTTHKESCRFMARPVTPEDGRQKEVLAFCGFWAASTDGSSPMFEGRATTMTEAMWIAVSDYCLSL